MSYKVNYTQSILQSGHYTQVPNDLLTDTHLTLQERMTWILIAKRQFRDRKTSWPGIKQLAQEMGVHEMTARGYLHSLRDKGYLRITERPGTTNVYELFYQAPPSAETSPSPQARGRTSAETSPTPSPQTSRRRQIEENKNKKTNTRSGKPTAPRRKQKYPPEWYKQALDAYQEIKGITLAGPEFSPLQQTLKSIFMAGHTPDEVISLMRELEASPLEWTANWTLRTVKMKLPEWKAGKLNLSPNGNGRNDDYIRALKEDIAQIDEYIEYKIDARLARLSWKKDLTIEEEEERDRLLRIREEKTEERERLIRKLKEAAK